MNDTNICTNIPEEKWNHVHGKVKIIALTCQQSLQDVMSQFQVFSGSNIMPRKEEFQQQT